MKQGIQIAALTLALSISLLAVAEERTVSGDLFSYTLNGTRYYAAKPPTDPAAREIRTIRYSYQESNSQLPNGVLVGPPTILSQCLDPGPATLAVGPSARARECTRQYCSTAEYLHKVSAYSLSATQSKEDQLAALTCIMRSEQDSRPYAR